LQNLSGFGGFAFFDIVLKELQAYRQHLRKGHRAVWGYTFISDSFTLQKNCILDDLKVNQDAADCIQIFKIHISLKFT
jgi:hypothetical protein